MMASISTSAKATATPTEAPEPEGGETEQPRPLRIHSRDFQAPQETAPTEETIPEPNPANEAPTQAKRPKSAPEKDFATCWSELFTELFHNDYLIYYSLNDEIPNFEDETIKITVKNEIQKEEFESRKKSILEYWRNHYDINVNDIEIFVNENKVTKKVIINSQDKLENMTEQNPELMDFLNILNFRIKD